MHERENALKEWVTNTIRQKDFVLVPLAGDASFRRYYRLSYQDRTQIIMDAPPEKESLHSFIDVANRLVAGQILSPELLAMNQEQGFLLLTDLGDELLLKHLKPKTVDQYYQQAIEVLLKMQRCSTINPALPSFDLTFMLQEMQLCSDWFLSQYLSLDLKVDEQAFFQERLHWIATEIAKQPVCFIHRDFHSRNLMLLKIQQAETLAVIDFQDAMLGPLTYDLVSLLKDCYISWPREQVLKWVSSFYTQNEAAQSLSFDAFVSAFDLCGLQRHLKVLGIFCRLHLRDHKPNYLKHLKLVLHYVLECCELYPELHSLLDFFQSKVRLT